MGVFLLVLSRDILDLGDHQEFCFLVCDRGNLVEYPKVMKLELFVLLLS
jgi:hypothetical protein